MCEEKEKAGQVKKEEEAEKEKQKEIEEKTDTTGEVWDVVFYHVFSVWMFRQTAKELARKILEQVSDAEIKISTYEWDFQKHRVYAKVEISKAIYHYIDIEKLKSNEYEIHAIDEMNFSTMTARTRKNK